MKYMGSKRSMLTDELGDALSQSIPEARGSRCRDAVTSARCAPLPFVLDAAKVGSPPLMTALGRMPRLAPMSWKGDLPTFAASRTNVIFWLRVVTCLARHERARKAERGPLPRI